MLAAGYVVHRIGRRSGATGSETRLGLPGDELVPRPRWQSTRAITVEAPPADVWPWIVQMGYPSRRGGWYTPPLPWWTGPKDPSASNTRV